MPYGKSIPWKCFCIFYVDFMLVFIFYCYSVFLRFLSNFISICTDMRSHICGQRNLKTFVVLKPVFTKDIREYDPSLRWLKKEYSSPSHMTSDMSYKFQGKIKNIWSLIQISLNLSMFNLSHHPENKNMGRDWIALRHV